MKNINPTLKLIKNIMADGETRSPEAILSILQMMGNDCFPHWIDLFFVSHLAGLERFPKKGEKIMLRIKKCHL